MTPQFVDFNADGHTDIVTATFDGSPHLALGSEAGFGAPEHILDAEGRRLMLTKHWDYKNKSWESPGGYPSGHVTSARAFDWDGDGDLDLLFGDYKKGKLFLRENEGTRTEPAFPGDNLQVEVDGKPLALEGGIASFELVDWDGDGLDDLLVGGYGKLSNQGPGARVTWFRNEGVPFVPSFGEARVLISGPDRGGLQPDGPDQGLHIEVTDWNADGRLDLLVGGYSHWKPAQPELSEEETAEADRLQAELEAAEAARQAAAERINSDGEGNGDFDEFMELLSAQEEAKLRLEAYRPGPQRVGFVWVYLQR